MSKRLQVLLEEGELRDLQEAARRRGIPLSEWVRAALRDARRRDPRGDLDSKLRALRAAVKHDAPTGDIDQMLGEIEAGYAAARSE